MHRLTCFARVSVLAGTLMLAGGAASSSASGADAPAGASAAGSRVELSPLSTAGRGPIADRAAPAPCKPSTSRIEGGPAVNYCGPATATLRVSGKTYRFKSGYCQSIPGFEDDIALGTFAKGKGGSGTLDNGKKPYFRLDLGPGESSDLALTYFGGNLLSAEGPVSFRGRATSKGTFKSLSAQPAPFSGSWDCHGVFVKG